MTTQVDILIIGGGIAGLWTLDELHRRGYSTLLVEHRALGTGQTICSQGIIHGGLKYTLSGLLTQSADAIREMPTHWHACLQGRSEPHLTSVRILSPHCHLWRTASLASRVGLIGAQVGLRTPAEFVSRGDLPIGLQSCPGEVFRVAEPVLDVASLLTTLCDLHRPRIRRGTPIAVTETKNTTNAKAVTLRDDTTGIIIEVCPRLLVLAAGSGNARLRTLLGIESEAMQSRPLHMVLVRGRLPAMFGHCVDGAKTRVTITTNIDSGSRTVWHVGGELAEAGVKMEPTKLIEHARRELNAVLPGIDWMGTQWGSYRVDRAEGKTKSGMRPDDPTIRRDGNVLTAWPTKLALAPRLAAMIANEISGAIKPSPSSLDIADGPGLEIALPPWETCTSWRD